MIFSMTNPWPWLNRVGIGLVLLLFHPFPALSDTRHWLDWCDDRALGWNFYCDPAREKLEEHEAPTEMVAPSSPHEAQEDPLKTIETMRKRLDWLKARAVLDPSPQNLRAYLVFQQAQLNRASVFADQWRRVVWGDSSLDYRLRRPTGTLAKQVWLDERRADIEDVLANLGERYGLFFFFNGQNCPACRAAASVLEPFAATHHIPVQAVSLDGAMLPQFPHAAPENGQAKRMGLDTADLPIFALFDSRTKQVVRLGAGVLAANELAGRIYVQTQLSVGEDY